jgi:DNA topoisomerase-1
MRYGRFGKFIGCSTYPECKYTEPWLDKIGVACPRCGGDLVEKRTQRGRTFYGCSNYPACEFTSWKRPLSAPCPNCGGLLVEHNRNQGPMPDVQRDFERDEFPDAMPRIGIRSGLRPPASAGFLLWSPAACVN